MRKSPAGKPQAASPLKVSRTDMSRLLTQVTKVVNSRNTIPILDTVRLVAADGKLTATATDLDIEVTGAIPCEGSLAVCVDAKMLASIVGKLPEGDIDVELKDGGLAIKAGRSRFKLQTLSVDDFPSFAADGFTAELQVDLASLCAPVQFAISTEETRYYLNGIYLHTLDGTLVAVATDGHRLAKNSGNENAVPSSVAQFDGIIIPRKAVGLIPKGAITVALSATKIRFTSGDTVITSKLIDGTYPDYQRVIPQDNDRVITFDAGAMAKAAERVSVVATDRTRGVKISLAPDQATLAVNNPESGSADEEVSVDYKGEPIEVGFNSAYLSELVGQFPAGEIRMSMADAGSPAVFTSDAAPGMLAVLMPMRI